MSIRSFFAHMVDHLYASRSHDAGPSVNPATGLPMLGGSVDIGGNPYGTDLRRHDDAPSPSGGFADDQPHAGSPIDNDWSGSSWSGASSSWPDHSSSASTGGYDPSRGW